MRHASAPVNPLALAVLIAVATAYCTTVDDRRSKSVTEDTIVTRPTGQALLPKPSHEQVVAAVKASGDKELEHLARDPTSYVLRYTEMADVAHHDVYRVLLTQVSHPMSFWLAVAHGDSAVSVLTHQLEAIQRFLLAEPALMAASDLPARIVELFRYHEVRVTLLSDPAPRVERSPTATRLWLAVDDEGRRRLWDLTLPATGRPTLVTTELPP
jgi:hypothetical protein